mgnify:FL=1
MEDESKPLLSQRSEARTSVDQLPTRTQLNAGAQASPSQSRGRRPHSMLDKNQTLTIGLVFGSFRLFSDLIWAISFWLVLAKTDPTTCTGPLYQFGVLAKWCTLSFFVWDLIQATLMRCFQSLYNKLPLLVNIFTAIYYGACLLLWIYSILALIDREQCAGQLLTSLVWVWVILYVLLPVVFVGCLCCGACVGIIFTAGIVNNPLHR